VKGYVRVILRRNAARRGRRLGRTTAAAIAAFGLIAGLVIGTSTPAAADPPLTVEDAKAQVAELQMDASAIDQQYDAVKAQIAVGQAQLAQKQADVKTESAKVAAMRRQLGQVALAQFQNRTLDTTAQLFFTSNTDNFLNQVSTVEKVSQNQNSVLQDFQAEQAQLSTLERSAAVDLAALREQENSLAGLRRASDAKIAQSKALLAKLTEQERQRIAAEEARLAAQAKRQADQAQAQATTTKTRSSTSSKSSASGGSSGSAGSSASSGSSGSSIRSVPASGRGARALAFARAQLGKPYRFGAAGPGAYDCSGLTMAAWGAAGVGLPHSSEAQYGVGRPVAKSDLQPGDLVFFYSGVSHVALYVGNGVVIHAPHPGASVEYISMSVMPYVGARRPG
jgi:cell wall-associated NlpC family hydrolase